MNADLQNIVDQLNAERYAGTWWLNRATEALTPTKAGAPTEDELEIKRGHIRRQMLAAAVEEPGRQERTA